MTKALTGAAMFVAISLLAAPSPTVAEAFEPDSCAQRIVTPGPGDTLRTMNCGRQADCQAQADRAGRTIYQNGCFGVSPTRPAASPVPLVRHRGR